MAPNAGRRLLDPAGRSGEMSDRPDLADGSMHGVVDSDDVAVVDDLRMFETLLAGARHLEGDVGAGLEPRQPVCRDPWPGTPPTAGPPSPGRLRRWRTRLARTVDRRRSMPRPATAEGPGLVGQHRGGLDEAPVAGGDQHAVAARPVPERASIAGSSPCLARSCTRSRRSSRSDRSRTAAWRRSSAHGRSDPAPAGQREPRRPTACPRRSCPMHREEDRPVAVTRNCPGRTARPWRTPGRRSL